MSIAQKPDEITVVVENEPEPEVAATSARVTEMMLYVALSDGREVGVPLSHQRLRWLKEATPEQRNRWEILPDG
ncbi:MAG TPA: DUF2442 domain-containing protein, partial [Anaerolineales bacterium]|nr:DUF2442 domain-containing protein [Anaerolineales bacterium]